VRWGYIDFLFQMDVIHGLTLREIHPGTVTTAHGPLADLLTIDRGERMKPEDLGGGP
jgi:hypothetical protein